MTFQKAGDLAEQYGGAGARGFVEDGIDQVSASENQSGAGGGANIVELLGNWIMLKVTQDPLFRKNMHSNWLFQVM